MEILHVCDTNTLMNNLNDIRDFNLVITTHVTRELDKLKTYGDDRQKWEAREAIRHIEKNADNFIFDSKDYVWDLNTDFDPNYTDNKLLKCCVENNFGLLTGDIMLKHKARQFNVPIAVIENTKDDYKGYRYITLSKREYDSFYNIIDQHDLQLLNNEYLVVVDADNAHLPYDNLNRYLGGFKFDGQHFVDVKSRGFTTEAFGKFKPLDVFQEFALDSVRENKMTMIKGKAGSGKSLIAMSYTAHQMEKGKFSKYIMFVNPMASRNSAKLGFYPGTRDEKLLDSNVGSMLASKFGSKEEVIERIAKGEIMLLPFSDIRGFDTTGMNAIVHIIEAQNLDIDLMKLAIQRVGDDSKLIIDGDYLAQIDHSSYEGGNNGMRRVSEVFRGESYYGEIELPIIYRSEMAKRADLM
jgi:predicted ribonuclease YlaK